MNKTYTGVCMDLSTEEIAPNIEIKIEGNYEKAYMIKKFKLISRLSGAIIINDVEYELFGIKILNTDIGDYIGATAYENGESKYIIYILDDFENIILSELGDTSFISTTVAPATNLDEYQIILDKLNVD